MLRRTAYLVWVLAGGRRGSTSARGFKAWGLQKTIINRALALGRSLLANELGASSTRLALLIGLSASAVLVLVRVGTAVPFCTKTCLARPCRAIFGGPELSLRP